VICNILRSCNITKDSPGAIKSILKMKKGLDLTITKC